MTVDSAGSAGDARSDVIRQRSVTLKFAHLIALRLPAEASPAGCGGGKPTKKGGEDPALACVQGCARSAEQRQDRLRLLVGDRERLHAELLLDLQRLQRAAAASMSASVMPPMPSLRLSVSALSVSSWLSIRIS
jgi:hypothetical protein